MRMGQGSLLVSVLSVIGFAGCVSQSRFDRMVTEAEAERQARRQLEDAVVGHQGELGEMQSQLHEKDATVSQLQSASEADKARIAQLEKALGDAKTQVAPMGEGVEVFSTPDGFAYRIADQLLFNSGSTNISESGKKALVTIAKEIVDKGYKNVRVDGHTDSDPVVKTKTKYPNGNHELALERALSVFAVLTKDGNVPETVFTIAGYGPNHPVAKGESDAAKSKNRRVEIHVAVPSKS